MPSSRNGVTCQETSIFDDTAVLGPNPDKKMYNQLCPFFDILQLNSFPEMWVKKYGLSTPNDQQQLAPFTEQ